MPPRLTGIPCFGVNFGPHNPHCLTPMQNPLWCFPLTGARSLTVLDFGTPASGVPLPKLRLCTHLVGRGLCHEGLDFYPLPLSLLAWNCRRNRRRSFYKHGFYYCDSCDNRDITASLPAVVASSAGIVGPVPWSGLKGGQQPGRALHWSGEGGQTGSCRAHRMGVFGRGTVSFEGSTGQSNCPLKALQHKSFVFEMKSYPQSYPLICFVGLVSGSCGG